MADKDLSLKDYLADAAVFVTGVADGGEILFRHALKDGVIASDAETGGIGAAEGVEVFAFRRAAVEWQVA